MSKYIISYSSFDDTNYNELQEVMISFPMYSKIWAVKYYGFFFEMSKMIKTTGT